MEETLTVGVLPGPVSNWRNNKPHPPGDFLSPKTLGKSGEDDVQVRLEIAQRKYLDYLGYSQTDPPAKVLHNVLKASRKVEIDPAIDEAGVKDTKPPTGTVDFIQESLKLLEASKKGDRGETKRERGNSYREASKGYATTPSPPKSGKPMTANSNRRRSPKLLDVSEENLAQSMKRAHPTTPPGTGFRAHSVSYEDQRVAEKKVNRLPHLFPREVDEVKTSEQHTKSGDTDQVSAGGSRPVTSAGDLPSLSPRMKSWIEGANEYEKEVAHSLFRTLHADVDGKTRKGSTLPRATGVYVPGAKLNTKEAQDAQNMMRMLDKDIERQYNVSNRSGGPKFSEARPRVRKTWRAPSASYDGYVHVGSNFNPTRPPFMKSFDIAPDWCSEAKTYRRLVRRSAKNQGYKSV